MDNTPVRTVDSLGTIRWWLNDKLHREDGPAVEYTSGTKAWFQTGQFHRIDGPAVENADGTTSWYLFGEKIDPIVHFLKVGELALDNS